MLILYDSVWGADGNPAGPNMEILKQMKLSYGLKTGGDFSFFLMFIEMFTNEIAFASEVTRFNSRSVARIIVYSIALQTFVFSPKEKMYFFFEISRHSNHMIFELSKTMLVGDMRQMTLQCLLQRKICLRTVVEGKRKNIIYIISSA